MSKGKRWRLLGKETFLGILNGLAIGTTVGAVTFLWKGNPYLGLVVFLAMTFNLVAAGMAGTLIPLTLRALRIDPALASSIFLTTVTDVLGFGFLFLLARLFLPELR